MAASQVNSHMARYFIKACNDGMHEKPRAMISWEEGYTFLSIKYVAIARNCENMPMSPYGSEQLSFFADPSISSCEIICSSVYFVIFAVTYVDVKVSGISS